MTVLLFLLRNKGPRRARLPRSDRQPLRTNEVPPDADGCEISAGESAPMGLTALLAAEARAKRFRNNIYCRPAVVEGLALMRSAER
jgi:hypothetical protein